MPSKLLIMNIAGSVLQYVLLLLIYYFIYRVIRIIAGDLRKSPLLLKEIKEENTFKPIAAKLVAVDAFAGHPAGEIFLLGETAAIGRGENNNIVIDDNFVSHDHSSILYYKGEYWLTDLRSTNHTFLNDKMITDEVLLKNGDMIKVGRITFKFER